MSHHPVVKVLGIDFTNSSVQNVVDILKSGGLLVVPAAPALINIKKDLDYYSALQNADVVIPDSSYMVLLWNIFHIKKIKKISGFKFLKSFFNDPEVKKSSDILW